MRYKKDSQISVFIMLGLSLLLVTGLILYIESEKNTPLRPVQIRQSAISKDSRLLKEYIKTCLEKSSEDAIREIAKNGGLSSPKEYRYFNGKRYSYLCKNIDNTGCSPVLVFRQDIEQEISRIIEKKIQECVDFKTFEKRGYKIKKGSIKARSKIGSEFVIIKLDWPITIQIENQGVSVKEFSIKAREPLGELFSLANDIINNEKSRGNFDIIDFMLYSKGENKKNKIRIEKHRPFPDIIYSLKKGDLEFRFAIEGKEKKEPVIRKGCCYNVYDKMCYENSDRKKCYEKEGIYDPSINCECPKLVLNRKKADTEFLRCSNSTKTDIISWCSYGSLTGRSSDMPGTRHYMHYCIDGKEYVEECRDFRQEICVENNETINNKTYKKALCRENRWQDCELCKTESCCSNRNERDCYWNSYSACTPEVPVGIKFWEENSKPCHDIPMRCSAFGCTEDEKTRNKELCAMQSDCGYGSPKKTIGKKRLAGQGRDKSHNVMTNKSASYKTDEFSKALSLKYSIVNYYYNFPISRIFNPLFDLSSIGYNSSGFCRPWKAPQKAENCSSCGNNAIFCSEYICRSLGSCIYEEHKGIPDCHAKSRVKKNIRLSIWINEKSHRLIAEKSGFGKIIGKEMAAYVISPELKAYEKATIVINTSEKTVCSASLGPDFDGISFESYYFDNRIMSKSHNITINFPYISQKPDSLLAALGEKSVSSVIKMLARPEELLDRVYKKYKTDFEYYKKETGTDLYAMLKKKAEEISKSIRKKKSAEKYIDIAYLIAKGFESNRNYIFITCRDSYGNKKEAVIVAAINKNQARPEIVSIYPKNNSAIPYNKTIDITAFLSEPSECRYSRTEKEFSKMKGSFSCKSSVFDISPYYHGSYICRAKIKVTESAEKSSAAKDKTTYYIKCRANPEVKKEYMFKIKKGKSCDIKNTGKSRFMNISCSSNTANISFSLNMLQKNPVFIVNRGTAAITFYADKKMLCIYKINSTGQNKKGSFSTESSEKSLALGLFKYSAEGIIADDANISILCTEPSIKIKPESGLYSYVLKKAEPLKIILSGPENETESNEIFVVVNKNSTNCGYYKNSTLIEMQKAGNRFIAKPLLKKGYNNFRILCKDNESNTIKKTIGFYYTGE